MVLIPAEAIKSKVGFGQGGGYDPIFWVREAGLTYAQYLKDKLGSRGKAARALSPGLKEIFGLA